MITIKPIKPKFNMRDWSPKLEAAIKRVNEEEAAQIVKDFNATTASWSKRPRFIVRVSRDGLSVRTDNKIWNMLDQGTRPHDIYPKRGRFLVFRGGYKAKTRVRSLSSGSGGAFGPTVFAERVRHPGTYAREWSITAQQASAKRYPAAMQAAIDEVIK